jgi:hypothetical protein
MEHGLVNACISTLHDKRLLPRLLPCVIDRLLPIFEARTLYMECHICMHTTRLVHTYHDDTSPLCSIRHQSPYVRWEQLLRLSLVHLSQSSQRIKLGQSQQLQPYSL